MEIKVRERYQSNGKHGTVLATNRNNNTYPVVFLEDDGSLLTFTSEGRYKPHEPHPNDLKPIPKEYWVNVYRVPSGRIACVFSSKEEAEAEDDKNRVACVKFLEGEFH